MRRRRFLAGAGLVVSSVLAGCNGTETDDDPGSSDTDDGDDGDDEDEPLARVVESELVREREGTDEERVAVEGVVERVREEEITYLEVRVEFLGEEGEVLDSTVEHLDDVTEGDRWPFTVAFSGVGEAAARVTDHSATVVENP
ncbi:hypothetical protein GRS48_13405 [Halorubrum sp. JWXQ-INN 858]|uniref:FxLYD domain-containing protein n=1 Tax=Halorubrum sp. JWXQ-INN 858 TaxID=2690782 RepID=UPI00135A50B5|nr:FxLYD domain-containing protein [Halorubrum sp. JWXQ-INN 858]MWV65809.1 hypothetical protein [Halorubrum sp. JWXQ-INN 858]